MKETKEMYPSWCDDHGVRLENVKIKDLHDFKEHPFHVVERRQIMQWLLTDDALGRNIQTIRMSKNMTQNEVVAQMQLLGSNMSRSTLANIETGRRNNKVSAKLGMKERIRHGKCNF